MARNRVKLGSLTKQIEDELSAKLAIGESKFIAQKKGLEDNKDSRSLTKDKIYSWSTFKTYMKQANYFTDYCKETYGAKSLEDCKPYINTWLQKNIDEGKSAHTQKTRASALAKLYQCSTKDFIKTEVRHREKITRSRGVKVRDKHFSEKRNADLVSFCKSTGLRRAELKALTGDKLVYKQEEDKYYINVNSASKGGRERLAPIIGDIDRVIDRMKSVGDGKVFDKIPQGADIHGYRSDYATAIYKEFERPIEELKCDLGIKDGTTGDAYICRGELKGTIYDRKAMEEATKALGHNRISVVASNYLRSNEDSEEDGE